MSINQWTKNIEGAKEKCTTAGEKASRKTLPHWYTDSQTQREAVATWSLRHLAQMATKQAIKEPSTKRSKYRFSPAHLGAGWAKERIPSNWLKEKLGKVISSCQSSVSLSLWALEYNQASPAHEIQQVAGRSRGSAPPSAPSYALPSAWKSSLTALAWPLTRELGCCPLLDPRAQQLTGHFHQDVLQAPLNHRFQNGVLPTLFLLFYSSC